MTTPYLKWTDNKDVVNAKLAISGFGIDEINDYIESGHIVRHTGAYDSAGTAIYDGDVLVFDFSDKDTFNISFSEMTLQWQALRQDGIMYDLAGLLKTNRSLIVQPTADPSQRDDMELKLELDRTLQLYNKAIGKQSDLQEQLKEMTIKSNDWEYSYNSAMERVYTQNKQLDALGGGDKPKEPKYQVEYTGWCYSNDKDNPVFKIGCRTESYRWFINYWSDHNYDGSLTPSEIITQRAALDTEYVRVTGKVAGVNWD